MFKLIRGHQGTFISESTLNYLLVYAGRCNVDRFSEALLLINKPSSLALYDISKDKEITETGAGYSALVWLPQVIWEIFLIYIYTGTSRSIPWYPGQGLCVSSTLGKDLWGSNAHLYHGHHVKDSWVWRLGGGLSLLVCGASGAWDTVHSVSISVLRWSFTFSFSFKARLDGALSNLIWLKMSLLTAGGLGYMTSKGAFQPKAFYVSMILCLGSWCAK